MDIPEKFDVAIIGGGPAGRTDATMPSQKGYDVVLLDKVSHPRYQVGESLTPISGNSAKPPESTGR